MSLDNQPPPKKPAASANTLIVWAIISPTSVVSFRVILWPIQDLYFSLTVGARSLNIELQAAINPASEPKVERFGWTFAPGDKVMQIENDYDKEVDPEASELRARFDGSTIAYGFGELDALAPAYAATVHKSQGSEYPAVVIPVLTQHYAMLQRNLLYTGVTRGKRLLVLVGQKKAVAIAVRNVSGRRRWSKLDEWLGTEKDETTGPQTEIESRTIWTR